MPHSPTHSLTVFTRDEGRRGRLTNTRLAAIAIAAGLLVSAASMFPALKLAGRGVASSASPPSISFAPARTRFSSLANKAARALNKRRPGAFGGTAATIAARVARTDRTPQDVEASASTGVSDLISSDRPLILRSATDDIFANLALEQYLFASAKLAQPVMFTYRNDKTIVIGRHQNPWKECKVQKMEADGVAMCRRASGGGAVYQDLGNTCFSFLNQVPTSRDARSPPEADFKTINNGVLLSALSRLGVAAEASGRNDLEVTRGGSALKISGSAYKVKNDTRGLRSLHHGTMLLDVDTGALARYLTPDSTKLRSKGISSVGARVVNLAEVRPGVDHDAFVAALEGEFRRQRAGDGAVGRTLTAEDMLAIPEVREEYERSLDWEWRFGSSPAFEVELARRFPWALVQLNLDSKRGRIVEGKVFSDCLRPEFIDAFNDLLRPVAPEDARYTYDPVGLNGLLDDLQGRVQEDLHPWVEDIRGWLQQELSLNEPAS